MNYELFVAKRIIAGGEHKNSISSPITKIAVTAIALGIIVMLVAVATGSGLQRKIRHKISGFKGHIQITNYDNNNSNVSVAPIDKHQDFYPKFKDIKGIKNVQIFANTAGIIRTPTDFEGIIFKGVATDYDWSFFKEYLQQGRLPNFHQNRNKEILISKTLATTLQLKLNDTIQIWYINKKSAYRFKLRKPIIVGIYNTDFDQFDKTVVIGDIREVQKINHWQPNQIGGFEVLLDNFDDLKEKGDAIYRSVGATLDSKTIVEEYPAIFEWINLFDNNVWFIIGIMILIAGINMVTALLVLILERVKMIGIFKALGSSNWSIRKIFLYKASYLILKGLFWGNSIGIGLLLLQYYFKIITLDPQTYYVSVVPVHLTILSVLLLNIGTLILCFLMLLIPSYIITRISPSKSIRFA